MFIYWPSVSPLDWIYNVNHSYHKVRTCSESNMKVGNEDPASSSNYNVCWCNGLEVGRGCGVSWESVRKMFRSDETGSGLLTYSIFLILSYVFFHWRYYLTPSILRYPHPNNHVNFYYYCKNNWMLQVYRLEECSPFCSPWWPFPYLVGVGLVLLLLSFRSRNDILGMTSL